MPRKRRESSAQAEAEAGGPASCVPNTAEPESTLEGGAPRVPPGATEVPLASGAALGDEAPPDDQALDAGPAPAAG